MKAALDDVKILEYGESISAPYCSKLLADLGAEVIKIEKPFAGDSFHQVMYAACHERPADLRRLAPACPPGVSGIIGRMLEKDPGRRYQTAEDLVRDLDTAVQAASSPAPGQRAPLPAGP